jgi:hypothetical protein
MKLPLPTFYFALLLCLSTASCEAMVGVANALPPEVWSQTSSDFAVD